MTFDSLAKGLLIDPKYLQRCCSIHKASFTCEYILREMLRGNPGEKLEGYYITKHGSTNPTSVGVKPRAGVSISSEDMKRYVRDLEDIINVAYAGKARYTLHPDKTAGKDAYNVGKAYLWQSVAYYLITGNKLDANRKKLFGLVRPEIISLKEWEDKMLSGTSAKIPFRGAAALKTVSGKEVAPYVQSIIRIKEFNDNKVGDVWDKVTELENSHSKHHPLEALYWKSYFLGENLGGVMTYTEAGGKKNVWIVLVGSTSSSVEQMYDTKVNILGTSKARYTLMDGKIIVAQFKTN